MHNIRRNIHPRLWDLGIYVLLSFVILAIIFFVFWLGMSWDTFVKWIGFTCVTAACFWYYAVEYRAIWRRKRFWMWFMSLLLIHSGVWLSILARVQHWKFVWFTPLIGEIALFAVAGNWLFFRSRKDH
jgi:hypothetical protein